MQPTERWPHSKVLLAYHETICDQTDRPKGGLIQGTPDLSWDLHLRSNWPNERWPRSKVFLAYHETSIRDQLADRKVASNGGVVGSPLDHSRSNWPTEKWSRSKVLLAYHETIRDQTGRPKGGHAQRCSWLTMRPPFAIKLADRKVATLKGDIGLPWDLNSRSNWPTERWPHSKVLLAYHETICDQTDRPKGGLIQGTPDLSWDLHSRSNWPTERWPRSKVLLAYHATSIRNQLADLKVASFKVLLAYHETTIRDQTGDWKVATL